MIKNINYDLAPQGRLLSLDFFRGLTMFLLIAEWTHLFSYLADPKLQGTILHAIGTQFDHHPWHGMHFWDLVQPFFMFIVGVAMAFSLANQSLTLRMWAGTKIKFLNKIILRDGKWFSMYRNIIITSEVQRWFFFESKRTKQRKRRI